MTRRRRSKAKAQRRHLRRRIGERLGIEIDVSTMRRIVREIRSGSAAFVERQSNRVSVFRSAVADKPVIVVYDRKTKQIVTAWPDAPGWRHGRPRDPQA